MKKMTLFFLPLFVIFSACQKPAERKMTPIALEDFVQTYPGMAAIAEEKSALDVHADELEPARDENLVELTTVLGRLYTVYTETLPTLIEREKELKKVAINEWKERSFQKVDNAEEQAREALSQSEVSALRDHLATKIKANDVAKERFVTFNLMAVELKSQAESLIERATKVTPETKEALEKDQESFNVFGNFIQDEQRWLVSHPPVNDTTEVIEQWKMDHPHTQFLEAALKSYEETYR